MDPLTVAFASLRMRDSILDLRAPTYLPSKPRFDASAMACLRDRVFHWIEGEIRHGYRPGYAPPCRRVEIMYEPVSPRLELRFELYDGRPLRWVDGASIDAQTLSVLGFDRICRLFFDRSADNFNDRPERPFDWRSDIELRNRVEDCCRGLLPRPTQEDGYRLLGVDHAAGPDSTATYTVTGREVEGVWIDEAAPLTATQQRAMEEHFRREYQAALHYGGGRRAGRTYAHALEVMRAAAYPGAQRALFEEAQLRQERADAEARGESLLREWLSPEQLAQYERDRAFEVVGCHSKRRYWITRAPSFNVLLLDSEGQAEEQICFMPEGRLVMGDQLLAQKVALETDENAAMAVANKQWLGPRSSSARRLLGGGFVDGTLGGVI